MPCRLGEALLPWFASLLLSLMHDDQLDDVLAANSMRTLARLLGKQEQRLNQDLVPFLPLQLLAMGMRRLLVLRSGPPTESVTVTFVPVWLEEFIWFILDFGHEINTATGSSRWLWAARNDDLTEVCCLPSPPLRRGVCGLTCSCQTGAAKSSHRSKPIVTSYVRTAWT